MDNQERIPPEQFAAAKQAIRKAADRLANTHGFIELGSKRVRTNVFFCDLAEGVDKSERQWLPKLFEGYLASTRYPVDPVDRQYDTLIAKAFQDSRTKVIETAQELIERYVAIGVKDRDAMIDDVRLRDAAIGAIRWASTIGRMAEPLLDGLNACANAKAQSDSNMAQLCRQRIQRALQLPEFDDVAKSDLAFQDKRLLAENSRSHRYVPCADHSSHEWLGRTYLYSEQTYSLAYETILEILARDPTECPADLVASMIAVALRTQRIFGEHHVSFCFAKEQWLRAISQTGGFVHWEQQLRQSRRRALTERIQAARQFKTVLELFSGRIDLG